MKKAEFISTVASKVEMPKKDVSKVIDAMLQTITEALKEGKSVSFIGFGAFTTSKRAARKTKLPGTEKLVDVPETKVVKFKVGKQLKEEVANS